MSPEVFFILLTFLFAAFLLSLQALEVYELFLFLASVLTTATSDSVALKSPIFILKALKQASFTISV